MPFLNWKRILAVYEWLYHETLRFINKNNLSINCRIRLKVFIIMLEKLFKLLRKPQVRIKHVRITRYAFMLLLATAMVLYNFRFLEFLIARDWYNWITSYSTHVVEVSVIQSDIAQDLPDGQILNLDAGVPPGYLG